MNNKLLVIIGPTAVGKTNTSIALAKALNGEIISGDSMQIYKGMDIGTAKITKEEMQDIPHYLLDIKDPEDSFSVAEFQELVRNKIDDISTRGKLPIIVGGTGLYISAVIYDYQFSEAPSNEQIRKKLEEQAEREGNLALHKRLMEIDPATGERIHPNNIRRVIRAIEVYECTGKTMTAYLETQKSELLYDTAIIGLTMEREKLYERINLRVDMMMEEGLLAEVNHLYEEGIKNCQSIQAIGYKELYDYLEGRATLHEAVENLKKNSRHYAKRQLTWFRNKMDVEWFNMTDAVTKEGGEKKISEILSYIEGKLTLKANTYM